MELNQDVLEGLEESTLVDIIKAMKRHHDNPEVALDTLATIYGTEDWACTKCGDAHHPLLGC